MQEIQRIWVTEELKAYDFRSHKTCEQLEIMFPNGYEEYWYTIKNDGTIIENTFSEYYNGKNFYTKY